MAVPEHGSALRRPPRPYSSPSGKVPQTPEPGLDLRSVTFIDCSGLAALCRARNRVKIRGGRLRLVTSSPSVLRLLRLTGLAHAFEMYPRLPTLSPVLRARAAPFLHGRTTMWRTLPNGPG
ncbi:STAS domain-containing protein [Streptomyces sp. NBC_00258]|uniref:STAS domain-containing protein n=1 Tax=Streptomyces sp. NBC_00258 TaxID=2903642 RepID=UPI003247F33E